MTHRIERVNQLIRRELSELLCRYVKDPRLGNFITVTEVSVSRDLRLAKVFISFLGSEEEKQVALKTLKAASGYFHAELSRRLKMRRVPEISFQWDDSIERGSRILGIIDKIDRESGADNTSQA
ncbi:MAG: 30S ribosome-binding factor RbfA [Chloroflexota bacterium]